MNQLRSNPRKDIPWLVQAIVVLGALLMLTGASLALFKPAMLVSPIAEISPAVTVYAGYLVSRNLGIALALLVALSLMLLTALVQIIDAVVDCFEGRWTIAPGVIVIGVLFLFGAARLSGHGFWRIEAWRLPQMSSSR